MNLLHKKTEYFERYLRQVCEKSIREVHSGLYYPFSLTKNSIVEIFANYNGSVHSHKVCRLCRNFDEVL